MNQLCSDVILDHPFLRQHSEVSFQMGGPEAPIKILKQDVWQWSQPRQKHHAYFDF